MRSGKPTTILYEAGALLAACMIGCGSSSDDTRPPIRDGKPTNGATSGGTGGAGANAFGNSPVPMGGAGSAAPTTPVMTIAPSTTCAEGDANTSPVTPTVWLVLDGSGSMNEDFGG